MIPHLRLVAGLADEALDLLPGQPEAHPGGGHHVFLQHGGAEVVGPELQGDLRHLGALGHPGDLQVGHIVQHQAGDGQGPQVLHRPQGLASQVGAAGLEGPGDEGGEAAGFVL